MPKISVIMNCLNGERLVKNAIESVYAQTFSDWEIVFWDNASTDGTEAIAKSFDDGRLRYFCSDATVPLGQARQWAIAEAKADWVTILDYDDAFRPWFFERHMEALNAGDYTMSYCGYRDIDENGNVLRDVYPKNNTGFIFPRLLEHYEINIATVMMRREALLEFARHRTSRFTMAEDYYLYLSLAARGQVCVIPEILAIYRQVSSSWTERALHLHAVEFHETLDLIERDLPGITARYKKSFGHARAHAEYARAKYLMHIGDFARARQTMAAIYNFRKAYVALYLAAWIPPLWRLIHRRSIKSRLTALLLSGGANRAASRGRRS